MKKYILLGEKYVPLLKHSLENLAYTIVPVPDNPSIDPRLSGHTDLSIFYDNLNTVFMANYLKNHDICKEIHKIGAKTCFIPEIQSNKYPNDAQLNICLLGNHFICNPKTASKSVIEHLKQQGREEVICKQGYTRCSVCIVDEKSLITSDNGIAEKCAEKGLDVLKISQGGIVLDGFDYGFIGGASIKLSEKLIAFTGSLARHPEYGEIENFIKSKGLDIIYLSEYPAFDIGSVFILNS